jgi:hypothetical protein
MFLALYNDHDEESNYPPFTKENNKKKTYYLPLQQNDDDKTNKGREIRMGGKCSKNRMKTT